jgi:hypothetical protein
MVNHRRWLGKISLGSLPLGGSVSAVPSFQLRPVFSAVSSRVPSGGTMSRFVGPGDKSWDNFKNFFQTQDVEFLFLSQRPRLAAFGGSMTPKTPVLKLSRPLARKPPAAIVSELTRAACGTIRKTPGRRLSPSVSKVSSLGWLAYELANGPSGFRANMPVE